MKRPLMFVMILVLVLMDQRPGCSWGFFAHQKISWFAILSLPPAMIGFYKQHQDLIVRMSVNPDKRRYILSDEGPRHFIDLEKYGHALVHGQRMTFKEAKEQFTLDSLMVYGIVPWQVVITHRRLVKAMRDRDKDRIIRYSADLSHYIADSNVPLHTTENYNGQLTGQRGIHGLWESRLPELFFEDYDLLIGKPEYVMDPGSRAWQTVWESNSMVKTVLDLERKLTAKMGEESKFVMETRNRVMVRTYSREFSRKYNRLLKGMVEKRLRSSIHMVAEFWYTAWIDAGQPDLNRWD